jgi:hypothetical protein
MAGDRDIAKSSAFCVASGLASPFRKAEGEGEGFRISRVCEFQTPHFNPLPALGGKTGCGFMSICADFIKLQRWVLQPWLLKQRVHSGMC